MRIVQLDLERITLVLQAFKTEENTSFNTSLLADARDVISDFMHQTLKLEECFNEYRVSREVFA